MKKPPNKLITFMADLSVVEPWVWKCVGGCALIVLVVWSCGRVDDSEQAATAPKIAAVAASAEAPASDDIVGKASCWATAAQKNQSAEVCERREHLHSARPVTVASPQPVDKTGK